MSAEQIQGTEYAAGDEMQHEATLRCPERCEVPPGLRLVQVVPEGTPFSTRCPNACGLALRIVP